MSRAVRLWILIVVLFIAVAAAFLPRAGASEDPERTALLEDLRAFQRGQVGPIGDDIFHHPERPGKVVRVVPWFGADGHYAIVAITEVGWVYRTNDLSNWELVGKILETPEF